MKKKKQIEHVWKCEYCGKTYDTKKECDRHEKKCRNKEEKDKIKHKKKLWLKIKPKRLYEYGILLVSVFIICFIVLWSLSIISICGDSRCDHSECSYCKHDCTPHLCINGICDIGIEENCENSKDCSCDTGYICALSRSNTDEKGCCALVCGDGFCDRPNEVESNCCLDCGCLSGYECINNKCEIIAPEMELSYQTGYIYPTVAYSNPDYWQQKGYSWYQPLKVTVRNPTSLSLSNVIVKAKLEGYSSDWSSETIGTLDSMESEVITFYNLMLSSNILSITEKIPIPVNIEVSYSDKLGNSYKKDYSTSIEVFGRNFYTPETSPAWITSKSDAIREFATEAVGTAYTGTPSGVEKAAEMIFDQLGVYGVQYVSDPRGWGDYLQFPAETLIRNAGDCDDVAVLYAALLESVGIKTQIVTIPSHMFMRYYDGQYWHSVETTLIGSDFYLARSSGATTFNENIEKANIIDVEYVWHSENLGPVEPDLGHVPLPKISLTKNPETSVSLGWYNYQCTFKFTNTGDAPCSRCGNFYIMTSGGYLKNEHDCLIIGSYSIESKQISTGWILGNYEITCEFVRD